MKRSNRKYPENFWRSDLKGCEIEAILSRKDWTPFLTILATLWDRIEPEAAVRHHQGQCPHGPKSVLPLETRIIRGKQYVVAMRLNRLIRDHAVERLHRKGMIYYRLTKRKESPNDDAGNRTRKAGA